MALLSPAARQGTGPLARLMREGGLYCVFQPLADLREGQVYTHEALIRGPQNTPWHTPDKLLELARREGILQDFELLCVGTAMEQWGRHDAPGRLFVNISADALVHGVQLIGATELGNTVRSLGLSARMLVLEITEHDHVTDMPSCARPSRPYTPAARGWRWTTLAMAAPACGCGPRSNPTS